MSAQNSNPVEAYIILSAWKERAYRGDTLSTDRMSYSFTLHETESEALERLISELQFCLTPYQRKFHRRCVMGNIEVPSRVVSEDGLVARWCSDRPRELARRLGLNGKPAPELAIEAAFENPKRHLFLAAALEAAEHGMGDDIIVLLQGIASMPEAQMGTMRPVVMGLMGKPGLAGMGGEDA